MKYGELTRKLRKLGVRFRRVSKGSHEIWWHPGKDLYTLIPRHAGKEITKKTLHSILRDLDLREDDLR